MKYIIGSGWWCSEDTDFRDKLYGDDFIRGSLFHDLWKKSILKNAYPESIFIVDSNSPIKPNIDDEKIKFISLNENAGHSTNHQGKYSGWMRSVILSMSYAQNCNCDYFVYIEQDVLIKGKGIIEYCISHMKKNYMFGRCHSFGNPLQQSFFIISKDGIDNFLSNIFSIKYSDFEMPPERKFALASSRFCSIIPKFIFKNPKNKLMLRFFRRFQNKLAYLIANFDSLPFGYGRDRPINFDDEFLYFQHGSMDEIEKMQRFSK